MSPDVPEGRDVGVDEDGAVEVLGNGGRKAVLLPLLDNQPMRILVDWRNAPATGAESKSSSSQIDFPPSNSPALDAQMMMHQLNRGLVLLKRNLNDFKRLPLIERTKRQCQINQRSVGEFAEVSGLTRNSEDSSGRCRGR
jgi:hypothetical protein